MSYGVIGGGLMGSGIAFVLSSQLPDQVILYDISDSAIDKAKARIEKFKEQAIKRGADENNASTWVDKIKFIKNLEGMKDCKMVVEAVFEDLQVKQEVFKKLDEITDKSTILASNTSGISISEIASITQHPERVIGTHFFNPAPVMKLVELVTGIHTSVKTIETVEQLCNNLGKKTVISKDYPGFIVTRIGQAMMCEAIRCLEEGVATAEDIDQGMRLGYNYPMGPLELIDLIGLDTELKIQQSLHEELGEVFRPSPVLKQMVAGGLLGHKTGKGFYSYE